MSLQQSFPFSYWFFFFFFLCGHKPQPQIFLVIPSACCLICACFPLVVVALILHSASNGEIHRRYPLKRLRPNCWKKTHDLLENDVWLEGLKCSFKSYFSFVYPCTCTFFHSNVCVKGSKYFMLGFFHTKKLFCYCHSRLPFSVDRQACGYWLIYVNFCFIDIFISFILSYQAFSFNVCFWSFVTRVLALCRDGSKQMSDLPFFFIEDYIWVTTVIWSWWPPKLYFQCMTHLQELNCELCWAGQSVVGYEPVYSIHPALLYKSSRRFSFFVLHSELYNKW